MSKYGQMPTSAESPKSPIDCLTVSVVRDSQRDSCVTTETLTVSPGGYNPRRGLPNRDGRVTRDYETERRGVKRNYGARRSFVIDDEWMWSVREVAVLGGRLEFGAGARREKRGGGVDGDLWELCCLGGVWFVVGLAGVWEVSLRYLEESVAGDTGGLHDRVGRGSPKAANGLTDVTGRTRGLVKREMVMWTESLRVTKDHERDGGVARKQEFWQRRKRVAKVPEVP